MHMWGSLKMGKHFLIISKWVITILSKMVAWIYPPTNSTQLHIFPNTSANVFSFYQSYKYEKFLLWLSDKESVCQAGEARSIPGRASGEGNGNPLQYSCLENPLDRGAWQAISVLNSTGFL